ncbi:hypothetical protein GHO40_25730 [Pseudomonas helleri]|uniref:Uncharacterized protein n=2 Tax=Pseudomonas helleri TaxID=1608996 RepID=A0A6L5HT58_9PSED|nr:MULTISPECIES: hypothetical protein [Pseudomonas]MQT50083.1 hypothetical protein [Pseudomonas helleri]MQT60268.1 hypothetical protein [Pseudomonas sp. FSL R10-0399]MQT88726.1 hypothetical protein [Pseudomonas helleri]MQU06460.1 hypothetical protein [Pseudomonas helleri]
MGSPLDEIRHQTLDAEPVLKQLDVEMEGIQFDPLVPSSVDAAYVSVDQIIENLFVKFKSNPILGSLAEELKSQYLDGIQAQVADARNGG